MIPPETVGDDDDGRAAGLIEFGAEDSSELRLHAEHGKIIGRYKLAEDALRLRIPSTLKDYIERDADLKCGDSGEQVLLLPKLLDVVIGYRLFRHHQFFGVRRCRQITEQQRPFRAVYVCRQPNTESHRKDAHQREA